jgi:hypothetical protein
MTGTRAIILWLHEAGLLEYLTGKRVIANIPEGAIMTACWFDGPVIGHRRFLCIRVEHESFNEVPQGRRIPRVKARFRRLPE